MTGLWWEYAVVFGASAALCLLLTPLAIVVAVRIGVLDRPGLHKSHKTPTPYLGGAAIVLAFSTSVIVASLISPPESGSDELVVVLLLAVGLALVGLFDDLRSLSPTVRLVAEVLCGIQLWRMDAGVAVTEEPFLDAALTVFWVVGITNAFNLLDNMDGLSAGQTAVCSATIFAVAANNGQFLVAGLAAGLAGCAVGFLRHNFHPARIYMGDGGALFLGFMISYLGLKLRLDMEVSVSLLVPVIACSVPIMDTTLVTATRLVTGRSPFEGGQDHISHRLVKSGLSVPVAVGATYFASASIGVLCFVISRVDTASAWILAGLVFATLSLGGMLLSLVPVYPESRRRHFSISEDEVSD